MTQRKFKNLNSNTGDLYAYQVETEENWYYEIYHNYSKVGEAPPVIIENSNDWQEITEFRLVVEGRWHIFEKTKIGRAVKIYNDAAIQFDDCFDFDTGVVIGKLKNHARQIDCEASTDQIHQALDAIRVEKGLVEGVKVETNLESCLDGNAKVIIGNDIKYNPIHDSAFIKARPCNVTIYKQGQWASKVEPVLVTEDNMEIYDVNTDIFIVEPSFRINRVPYNDAYKLGTQKYFYKEENAQAYIEQHRPKYSDADLKYLQQVCKEVCKNAETYNSITEAVAKGIFMGIDDLRRSKQTISNQ